MKRSVTITFFMLFFVFGVALAQPTGQWPMFHHDVRHTGLSEYAGPSAPAVLGWSYLTGDSVYSSPAIGSDGGIYVGSDDDNIYALSSAGSFHWSYLTGNNVWSPPAIGSDGWIYVGSDDRNIYALSSAGSLGWTYLTGSGLICSPAIGSDGGIYVGSGHWDKNIYALSSAGSFHWSYLTGDNVLSSPVIGSDGGIYVGSYDNNIYALSSDRKSVV